MSLEQLYQTRALLTTQLVDIDKLIAAAESGGMGEEVIRPAAPRMRTAAEAVSMLRKDDPETRVTQYFIKRLIAGGTLKVHEAGGRKLVNYDYLLEYLNGMPESEKPKAGKIRRIEER